MSEVYEDGRVGAEDTNSDSSASQSRRRFIRKVGGALFALTLVDIADVASMSKLAMAQSGSGCGAGNPDASCSTTNPDENCGLESRRVRRDAPFWGLSMGDDE